MRKIFRKIALTLLIMVSVVTLAQKPKVRILATGGTIAGVSKSTSASCSSSERFG